MDNCCEQNVCKVRTKADTVKIVLILAAAALVSAAIVFFSILFGLFLFALFGIGTTALGIWLTGNFDIEYEYILVNNEMDIDKIIGKRKRKRLITIDISKASEFEKYPTDSEVERDVTVHASSGLAKDAAYLVTEHSDYGKVMVIFNPNETMREAMERELPRALRSANRNG